MKQSDIITVILIAVAGVVVSAFACNAILGDPDEATATFTTVTKAIESDLAQPDAEVFNTSALNPTVEVFVGNCEDVDQNGSLDSAELLACGQAAPEVEGEDDDDDDDTEETTTNTQASSSSTTISTTNDDDDDEDEDDDDE